jgi:hypothetical protein
MPIAAGPEPGGGEVPEWLPLHQDVADFVPHRTLVVAENAVLASQDVYLYGFGPTTRPTDATVGRLIVRALGIVTARINPVPVAWTEAARTIASMIAAAWVERGWPEDDLGLTRANDLEKRAWELLDDLVKGATSDGDGDGVPGLEVHVAPVWSFPPADPRYDSAGYW